MLDLDRVANFLAGGGSALSAHRRNATLVIRGILEQVNIEGSSVSKASQRFVAALGEFGKLIQGIQGVLPNIGAAPASQVFDEKGISPLHRPSRSAHLAEHARVRVAGEVVFHAPPPFDRFAIATQAYAGAKLVMAKVQSTMSTLQSEEMATETPNEVANNIAEQSFDSCLSIGLGEAVEMTKLMAHKSECHKSLCNATDAFVGVFLSCDMSKTTVGLVGEWHSWEGRARGHSGHADAAALGDAGLFPWQLSGLCDLV